MVTEVGVRRIGPDDWTLWRGLRLAALADAPDAFGSSSAVEREFDEDEWRARLAPEHGLRAVAFAGQTPAGIVGGRPPAGSPPHVELVGMWVHPDARGGETARLLVGEVLAWAGEQGCPAVSLFVTETNDRARRLYERFGFAGTGEWEPLESNPVLRCARMIRTAGLVPHPG
ncbi:GNAT family N-acetyltransferase [Microbispora sp. ATCC PTA-5024]|uniref:GNAT family N-acetyltransferase n=1 Tax=Microbispora sp. ATCC PTA-5024 TaxID=316330 RepID=UPI0003DBE078|nr:GNAT family N-acetyltransferase [Microbispora sp. ATCC PTA-5024]ETK35209.1 hypothetical protein MPTA5024_15410 [Microbispora sp. ATCC PTA-5024]